MTVDQQGSEPAREGSVESRPHSRGRIQPQERGRVHVPDDVDDWERRLAADDELIHLLQWEGFVGPQSEKLYKALMEYGHQVIGAWIFTGVILSMCRQRGAVVPPGAVHPLLIEDSLEREDMTAAVIARAVVGFRDNVLKPRKWSAAKGATLKTFFIGQALFRFASEYRDWLAVHKMLPATVSWEPRHAPLIRSPELQLIERAEMHRELVESVADQKVREMAVLVGLGYSHKEIAELLELASPKVVETHMYRLRRRRKQRDDAA